MRRNALKLFAATVLLAFALLIPATSEAIDPYCKCDRCTGPTAIAWPVCLNPLTETYTSCATFAFEYCSLTEEPPVGPVGPTPPR